MILAPFENLAAPSENPVPSALDVAGYSVVGYFVAWSLAGVVVVDRTPVA